MNSAMPRLLRLCLALSLLTLPALAQDWIEVRSPNFIVTTDTGLSSGRAVGLRFEQMRQVIGSILQHADVHATVPLHIIAFKTTREMQTALPHGAPGGSLYVAAPDAHYVLLDLSAPDPYSGIARDYARAVIAANTPTMSLWFDEGLAAYFSTINVGEKDVQLGRRPAFVEQALASHKLLPAATFLAVTRQSPESKQGPSSAYAAQSWLLMDWILTGHRLPAAYECARLMATEQLAPATAFERAFETTPAALDAELPRLLAGREVTSSYTLPDNLNDISTYAYQNRKLLPFESQVALADFHLHAADYFDQGVGEAKNILTQDPKNSGAERLLGYAALEKGDLEQAATHLARALELAPGDPRANYYSAEIVARGGQLIPAGGIASYEIRAHVLKALDGDPSYADAWFLLSRAYEVDEKYPNAIESIVKALKLAPRNDGYRLALARVYGESKQWDAASALLAYLKTSSDPEVAARAPVLAAQFDQERTTPKRTRRFEERPRPSSYDAPQWRPKPAATPAANATKTTGQNSGDADSDADNKDPDDVAAAKRVATPKADARPVLFLKGRLVAATCRASGAATLTVAAGKRMVQLTTPDYKRLVVIGANGFSCDWKDVNVAANYRASSGNTGDLISLELQ